MGMQKDKKKRMETATALLALATTSREAEDLQTACPAPEKFAAFLEGRAAEPEITLFFAHLERCESCYHHWLTVNEKSVKKEHSPATGKPKRYRYIGSALAVAASIAVFLIIREPAPLFMHSDETGIREVPDVEVVERPSLQATEEGQEKSAVEPMLQQGSDAGREKDKMNGERLKKLSSEPKRVQKNRQEMIPAQVASTDAEKDSHSGLSSWIDELRRVA